MNSSTKGYIKPCEFNKCIQPMREYCLKLGFLEVHPQNRLSILAACEDPSTIANFQYNDSVYPLPQTGQMWLEYELLKENEDNKLIGKTHLNSPGFFCVSTSYRNEPNPEEGRHEKIFPMFEFEVKGGMDKLIEFEKGLLKYLGFKCEYHEVEYTDMMKKYNVEELTNDHETKMGQDFSEVVLLKNFPTNTSPFWNMKLHPDQQKAYKVDVLMHGMETIGSAERSANKEEMKRTFHEISDGEYANTLYKRFGKERVENELNDFLTHDFFERSGGGIGVTRMIRAMKLSNLM